MRRKEFKSIVNGFAKHLASRNNDFKGYWSLGQLLSISKKLGMVKLKIQVLNGRCELNSPELESFALGYRKYFADRIESMGGCSSWLQSFTIDFTFSIDPKRTYSFWGEPLTKCEISVTLKTDLGREFIASSASYCVSHNSKKEQRRVHF